MVVLFLLYVCSLLRRVVDVFVFFFFQAEDGIRDTSVTGVQTCALPIWEPLEPSVPKQKNIGTTHL